MKTNSNALYWTSLIPAGCTNISVICHLGTFSIIHWI